MRYETRRRATYVAVGRAAFFGLLVVGGLINRASAADKGGQGSLLPLGQIAAASDSWTGCGVGIGENYFPNIGGHLGSVNLTCDLQAGQFVFGGAAEYGRFFGDLGDAGLDSDLTIRGRAGFLIVPNTLVYGHIGWARMDGDDSSVDGWKLGPGISINIPNSRVFVDVRYDYGVWDTPSGDDTTHSIAVGLTYKFGK